MKRKTKQAILGVFGILVAGAAGLVGYADHTWNAEVDAPYPQIQADRSPEGVTRGAAIFNAVCAACHVGPGSDRANGARMTEVPAFLGTFEAANITAHPTAGAGALKDEEIARTIRFGVSHHGHRTAMPSFSMSDEDVAAVIGFVRSDSPLFRADAKVQPPSEVSMLGKTILFTSGAMKTPELPAQGVKAPARRASPEYGKYLAESVYGCADCHTPGFSADKIRGPEAFSGGMEFRDAQGRPLYSANLTPDESGIAHYDEVSFRRAVREGRRPNGAAISAPMPQFKGVEDVELNAIYMYLQTLPKQHREKPNG